jgi:proteic killer suppression protein
MLIIVTKQVQKQLNLIPDHIYEKYLYWRNLLEKYGLLETRKFRGFHDEPLKGKRRGQRSVRLSLGYRAIYKEVDRDKFEVIEIIEVNKHEY